MQDCIYLTRAQIEALYALTFKQGRTRWGNPAIGVQIRGSANAEESVVFDAVLGKVDELAHAVVSADGTHGNGWEI